MSFSQWMTAGPQIHGTARSMLTVNLSCSFNHNEDREDNDQLLH
jgi:hypothetical protein